MMLHLKIYCVKDKKKGEQSTTGDNHRYFSERHEYKKIFTFDLSSFEVWEAALVLIS